MTSIKPSHDRRIPATNDRVKQKPVTNSTIDRWVHCYIVVCVTSSVLVLVFIVCLVGDRKIPWWWVFAGCAPLITWIVIWICLSIIDHECCPKRRNNQTIRALPV
ncbi:hypothetical protein Ddc_15611 [Ditylenchus destructor]|nr:hypothetical protein Ddc_15611 [Ditylenchus destructor]